MCAAVFSGSLKSSEECHVISLVTLAHKKWTILHLKAQKEKYLSTTDQKAHKLYGRISRREIKIRQSWVANSVCARNTTDAYWSQLCGFIFYVNLNVLFISLSLFFIFCLPEKSEDLPQITGKSSFLMESSENPTLIYPILAQLNLILMQDQKKFPKLYNISWLWVWKRKASKTNHKVSNQKLFMNKYCAPSLCTCLLFLFFPLCISRSL